MNILLIILLFVAVIIILILEYLFYMQAYLFIEKMLNKIEDKIKRLFKK